MGWMSQLERKNEKVPTFGFDSLGYLDYRIIRTVLKLIVGKVIPISDSD